MQLETNSENGNVHKKLFKKKNREDLSAAKSMQQEILRQSKVNAREENERDRQTYAAMDKDEKNWEKYWNVSVPLLTAGIKIILDSSKESPISFSQTISSNLNL